MLLRINLSARALLLVAAVVASLASGCSPERTTAHRFCKMWKSCQKDQFNKEYDSVRECAKLGALKRKANTYESTIFESRDCAKARRSYDRCYSKELTCDYFLPDAPTKEDVIAAEEWIDAAQETCGEELDEIRGRCE